MVPRAVLLLSLTLLNALPGAVLPESLDRPLTEKGFVTVDYPDGFDLEKSYSILYWFHGTGGEPNAGIGRGHERFVSIGMSYLKQENTPSGKYGDAHWKECLAVRAGLEAEGLKLDRNVVAGMSKGGWMSFYIAAEPRDGLHAVGIFAAGKDPNMESVKGLEGRGLAVLVGTGETDPNFPQAQLAVNVLKQAGAEVCYEEWLGEGHTYRRDGRVRDWLDVESRRAEPERLLAFCEAAIGAELKEVDAMADAKDRYVALRLLAGDPRTWEASSVLKKRVRKAGMELADDSAVKNWLAGLRQLRSLVEREAAFFDRRDFDVSKLDELVAAYGSLVGEVGQVDLAARAAYGYRRASKMAKIYTAQMKARENPEYQQLMEEYVKLQTKYGEAQGEPGEAVMQGLKAVGARLGELRHEASMGAFRDVEWSEEDADEPESVRASIEAGKALGDGPMVFGGLGF